MHWNWNTGYKFIRHQDGKVDTDADGIPILINEITPGQRRYAENTSGLA